MPAQLIDWQRLPEPAQATQAQRIVAGAPRTRPSAGLRPVITLEVGDRVSHDTFGLGTVVGVSGEGDRARAKVDFGGDYGAKELLLRYAPVEKI